MPIRVCEKCSEDYEFNDRDVPLRAAARAAIRGPGNIDEFNTTCDPCYQYLADPGQYSGQQKGRQDAGFPPPRTGPQPGQGQGQGRGRGRVR